MSTETKPNYKSTLNLPKTDFAMKANLSQNEPSSQKKWDEVKLYEQILKAREAASGTAFIFHDGPPYANGSIHVGHLLNKVLKDLVVRTRLMEGRNCPYIPGWDCHGLPIEHKVVTDLVESGKYEKLNTLTEDQRRMAIRRECAKYAEKYVKLQAGQMKRLSTLADYEHPYLTMSPEYEKGVLEVFADLLEQGIVYRALKPVHWSIANQTALAEAELEYEDREDLSVYVDFEAVSREAVAKAFGLEIDSDEEGSEEDEAEGSGLGQTPSFMIWTTTPWTLPANLAVAVHEKVRYSLVMVDGNATVIASDLVQKVTKAAKAEDVKILVETDGRNLIGLQYRHPFVDRLGKIVAAEYVTLEDGTGLVHTAPGHGSEDYHTGLREKLDIYCPVKGDGTFDDTVPDWLRGLSVWDANEKITNCLRESGHLFFAHKFTHSYPHDWRSKTPVIFRATEQWFIAFTRPLRSHQWTLKELALGSIDGLIGAYQPMNQRVGEGAPIPDYSILPRLLNDGNVPTQQPQLSQYLNVSDSVTKSVQFIPAWGRNRMRGMLESRPDWCISRQRAWGLPIPAFFGSQPDQVLLTPASVRALAKLIGEKGSDAWFQSSAHELLKYYDLKSDTNAPQWLGPDHLSAQAGSPNELKKSNDILDVWFESGSSWNAVLRQRGLGYPADLYLEGSDQHRGWFQASLLPALGATGKAPFKALLTHGFIVDKDGRKMSKSIGNTLEVDDLLKNYGADVCRWWVSSLAFENDIKMDLEFFNVAGESYRKVRNTLRFLLSNLFDFTSPEKNPSGTGIAPTSIDGYMLQQAFTLQKQVREAYEAYEFRRANQLIYDFCNETLSAFYCAAVKDRLYCDKADSPRRRATQMVMWKMMEMLARLLSPIMPHTADEAYRALWRDPERSVQVKTYDDAVTDFKADANWSAVLVARDAALKAMEAAKSRGIENPLDAEVLLPDPNGVLVKFKLDLPDMLGVSRVGFIPSGEIIVNDLQKELRCDRSWKRDGTVKQRADGGFLTDRDAEAVGV